MLDWVRALLDPVDIAQSPATAKKQISPPPKFEMPPLDSAIFAAPPTTRNKGRRSASPSKIASPAKKHGTPRKARQSRAQKEASIPSSSAANASLQNALDAAASTADSESMGERADETVQMNGHPGGEGENEAGVKKSEGKVTVTVESAVDTADDGETTHTTVLVEMPVGAPELPLPRDTEQMIAVAKEMVEEATKLQQSEPSGAVSSAKVTKKRKSDELDEEEGEADATEMPAPPAKRSKILEDRLRRERVRNRALVGVTATLAIA
jgi:hypothetical protein